MTAAALWQRWKAHLTFLFLTSPVWDKEIISGATGRAVAFVIVFLPSCVSVCLCVHFSTGGVHDLLGTIETLSVSCWQMSWPVTSIHRGRWGFWHQGAIADKTRLELSTGAACLPRLSWSSAEAQISVQQVLLVLGCRIAFGRSLLALRFPQIQCVFSCFYLTQPFFFILNCEWQITHMFLNVPGMLKTQKKKSYLLHTGATEDSGKYTTTLWQWLSQRGATMSQHWL